MTAELKSWQFRQEGLPMPDGMSPPRWSGNDAYHNHWAGFQTAVFAEASRCLYNICQDEAALAADEIPAAVQDIAGHLIILERGLRWGVLDPLLTEFVDYGIIFWPLLMHWWSDAEANCLHSIVPLIKRTVEYEGLPHEYMSSENKTFFDSLPETVNVYRGIQRPCRHIGICWTTDKPMAEWFARRFAFGEKKPVLMTGRVRKRNIITCFTDRGENEVVVLPKHVLGRTEEELPTVALAA